MSVNNSMVDFLVTFFIGDYTTSLMLSEIVKNRGNQLFLETLGFPNDFVLPFFQEEKNHSIVYTINQSLCKEYEVIINSNIFTGQIIHSGDYIIFKKKDNSSIFKMLLISTSDIQIGYKKYKLINDTSVSIGGSSNSDISFRFNNLVLKEQQVIIKIDAQGNAFIENIEHSVGVYVNGYLTYLHKLNMFDEIFIMGLSMIYMGNYIAIRNLDISCKLSIMDNFSDKSAINEAEGKNYFISTPRILQSLDTEEIEVEAPPSPTTMDKTPAILVVGPSLTMSLVMLASAGVSVSTAISGGDIKSLITSGTMAVGMLLGSLMWPMLLRKYQQKRLIADENYRKKRYSSYIDEIEQKLISKRDETIKLLNNTLNPSPEILCSFLDNEGNKLHLWERSYEDADFLSIRIGLGNRPFDVPIKIPKWGFQLHEDEMRILPKELVQKYGILSNVPLTLDMYHNHTIGMIGDQGNIHTILNEIILNIISLHSYNEVKLVLVTTPKQAKEYEIFKHVPHIWSNDKKVRYFATNSDEVHFMFNEIDEVIKGRENFKNKEIPTIPHYILIVTEPSLIEKEALFRYMSDAENKVGISTIFAYGDITKLPKSCKTIIQSDEYRTGYYIKNKNANRFIPFILDIVDNSKINSFVTRLSNLLIKRDVRSLGIVDRISFLQMYRAGNISELGIEQHWENNNSAKSLAAPIGVMAGGEVFNLDIHEAYHGCHGLVAGTTGSGKSEFLQAFILSLAINYSPKEVAFVLVDFKGGDMARPFMKKKNSGALPHLAATISNLSGNILYRALVSLEAEIKSRQNLFNESALALGVDKLDINSYHKYYKTGKLNIPLPHLIIIIDEFAQLKNQQPEFLTQLINVAQVGRSLGIHLILATQRPSGIVDPQIMSNSRFKICLKVADKQDSIEMINRPDSAMIKNPGRLYLQVGYNEIYECVQSGYSGANYVPTEFYMPDEEITVHMTDNTANSIHSAKLDRSKNKSDKTQLEAIVAEIVSLGQNKKSFVKPLWLEMLPKKVVLSNLAIEEKELCKATIGLVDYVRTQEQKPLVLNFLKTGHIGLYGASGTGKTTFLQTLVYSMVCDYKYTPDELTIYAMDFGGRNLSYLEKLPHTGGVILSDEENKLLELASVLHSIIEERKQLFAANNCGTFADYRAMENKKIPAILVLIDNFAPFHDKYMNICESFIDIISAGRTFGVYFIITGSTKNSIYYRVTEHIATYFTLKMNDPSNYLDIHNVRTPILPEDISGRGITVIEKEVVEFQIAIVLDSEMASDRTSVIQKRYEEIANSWTGELPIQLNGSLETYNNEDYGYVETNYYVSTSANHSPESISNEKGNLILGTSKSGALQYGISLSEDYKVCLCANDIDNMKNYYQSILKNITEYIDRKVVFIDDEMGLFANMAEQYPICHYIQGTTAFEAFMEDLKPELNSRLKRDENHKEQLFIIIAEFNQFFDMITDEQAIFMRKVFQYIDSSKYGIYFICGFNVNGNKNNDKLFMSLVVNAENYILCPNSYEKASLKIETLPIVQEKNIRSCYICLKEQSVEIRW